MRSSLAVLVRVTRANVFAAACLTLFAGIAGAQSRAASLPDSLTSAEFWAFFTSMSEPGGDFLSENFVSNEVSFQDVIPTLQKSLTKDGVYLGVGPEQNFTYISNLSPRLAVIFDIRRQNAMQHLMYKALFELSPNRNEFVSRLFSRPAIARFPAGMDVKALFDSAALVPASDSAYKANLSAIIDLLTRKHGFALPDADIESITHVYNVFFVAGTEVNYGYRSGTPGFMPSTYPTYGLLQSATNADTVRMAFLANDERYQSVRALQLKNLIVPVVGDFGGPSAITSVATWLRERELTVTAFYVSNVEQYLWRDVAKKADRFYSNVSALPIDTTSTFIRSVPRMGGTPIYTVNQITAGNNTSRLSFIITRDAAGNLVSQTYRDSAGVTLVQTLVDSGTSRRNATTRDSLNKAIDTYKVGPRDDSTSLKRMMAVRDSIIAASSQWQVAAAPNMQVVMGGTLTSGLASMDKTLKSFFMGELKSYESIVKMTKVSDWR